MKYRSTQKAWILLSLLLVVTLIAQVSAQPQQGQQGQDRRGGFRRGMFGDWKISMEFNDMQVTSYLSFSRNRETREMTGNWIGFWGVTELKDVKFEDNKLSFTQTRRFGDQEFTSEFEGTVEEGLYGFRVVLPFQVLPFDRVQQ